MPLALTLVTAPDTEPLTLDEAKDHLRVDSTDEDNLIQGLITAARQRLENSYRRAFVTQDWKLELDEFPTKAVSSLEAESGGTIVIPRPPLQSITSIKYIDTSGVQQTLASTEYKVDSSSEPARVTPAFGKSWPSTRGEINAVEVIFKAGYGATENDVPENIRHAMRLLIGHYYENREHVVVGGATPRVIPESVKALMPGRIHTTP